MVLSAPPADAPPGEDQDHWVERIAQLLALSERGILILVNRARNERLGELVRALLPAHPSLEVHSGVRRLGEAAPGSLLILQPRAEEAAWLNTNRPTFARQALRVIL